jgi:hypothetical protein
MLPRAKIAGKRLLRLASKAKRLGARNAKQKEFGFGVANQEAALLAEQGNTAWFAFDTEGFISLSETRGGACCAMSGCCENGLTEESR